MCVCYPQHNLAWTAIIRCSIMWLNHHQFHKSHVEIRLYVSRIFIVLIKTLRKSTKLSILVCSSSLNYFLRISS